MSVQKVDRTSDLQEIPPGTGLGQRAVLSGVSVQCFLGMANSFVTRLGKN